MEKKIEKYLMVQKKIIPDNICEKAILTIEKNNWEKHNFYYSRTNEYIPMSGDKEFEMSWSNGEIENELMKYIWESINNYVNYYNFSWFSGWNGHTMIRFNRYKENTKMAEHCDHINDMFDGERKGIPILSSLAILNDDYDGGDLIFWEDTKIEVFKGDIIVFPSNFLYPHRVDPVTNGIRYSCVSWVW